MNEFSLGRERLVNTDNMAIVQSASYKVNPDNDFILLIP
jgi:hypothetical protein